MKIVLTGKEVKAGSGIVNQLVNGANSIATVLGEALENLSVGDEISDETIAETNKLMRGICTITKYENTKNPDDTQYEFSISEEYVCDCCDLTRDFVIDAFDVIKYAVKTFKAFMALSVKPFVDKYQKIVSANMCKTTAERFNVYFDKASNILLYTQNNVTDNDDYELKFSGTQEECEDFIDKVNSTTAH